MNVINLPSRHFQWPNHIPEPTSLVDLKNVPTYTETVNGQEVAINNAAYNGPMVFSPNATNSKISFSRLEDTFVPEPGPSLTGNPVFNNSNYSILVPDNPQQLSITHQDSNGSLVGSYFDDVHNVTFSSTNPNSVNRLSYEGNTGNDILTISGSNGFLQQTTRNTWGSNFGNDTYILRNANNMTVILGESLMTDNPPPVNVSPSVKSDDVYHIGEGQNNTVIIQDVAAGSPEGKDIVNLYGTGWQNEGVAHYDVRSADGTQPGYPISRYNNGNYEKWSNATTGSVVYIAKDPKLDPGQPENNVQVNANVPQPASL